MKPSERENNLYKAGKTCKISAEEKILFEYLQKSVKPNSSVLDLGCGSGEISCEIKRRGHSVVGVDFSDVAIAQSKAKGLDCQLADLDEGIPFEDNSFNAVWAGDVIEHVFDPICVLKEINRVLEPSGCLLCTVPYDLNLTTRIKVLMGHSYQEGVYRLFRQYKHHTFFSIPLLQYMLDEARLSIKEIKYLIRFPKTQKQFVTNSKLLVCFAETLIITATPLNT